MESWCAPGACMRECRAGEGVGGCSLKRCKSRLVMKGGQQLAACQQARHARSEQVAPLGCNLRGRLGDHLFTEVHTDPDWQHCTGSMPPGTWLQIISGLHCTTAHA